MKTEFLRDNEARDQIKQTFGLMRDLIVPTMGARGRIAVLDQEMGQPTLTDDGVTVAKHLKDLGGYNRTLGKPFIEACHMTERQAYDGTTLTALLIDELYSAGYELIKQGIHPQVAADRIEAAVEETLELLAKEKLEMKPELVEAIASVATKMPQMGDLMKRCYDMVGSEMNVYVEWKRGQYGYSVKHEQGMNIDSGYMTEHLHQEVNSFRQAKLALIKTGLVTDALMSAWFESFPAKIEDYIPVVYVASPSMNPKSLAKIREIHRQNERAYHFIFLNASSVDDLYMDLAAISGGKIQSPQSGIEEYTYDMCGDVEDLLVGIVRSSMKGNGDISKRETYYKDVLEKSKFQDAHGRWIIENRLAALTTGIARVAIGVPTEAQFRPIRLKLDDAVGAVKKSFEDGILMGAGKVLYNLSDKVPEISDALRAPYKQILSNAGINEESTPKANQGYNVVTGKIVDLKEEGILDSYASIYQALRNASSIASEYLRVYLISKRLEIKKED